jgi:death-on-curing protein
LEAHEVALQFGGTPGVLDLGRVEAAINRPYSGYWRPIAAKAAALFEAVVSNHGFTDGNKRTALLLTDLLLKKSNYRLVAAHRHEDLDLEFETLAVRVASGELKLPAITEWFRQRIRRP